MQTPLRMLTCSLLMFAAPAFGGDAPAALPPVSRGQRIYAAHHSFFAAIPPILNEVARKAGFADQTFVGNTYIGGSKSLALWNVEEADNHAKEKLREGVVNVLILTPIYLPDAGMENFAKFGLEYNPDLRVTVQEFWLPFDEYQPHYYDEPKIPGPAVVDHNAPTVARLREIHARYFEEMDAHVREVNARLGKTVLFVVPVGQAVIALREKIIAGQAPGLKTQEDLFSDALGHPKPVLEALIAYAHFAVIYRKNPVGLPTPQILVEMGLPPDETDGLNRLLQQLAWDAVTHHPLSGVQ